jgi:hypothetical protein
MPNQNGISSSTYERIMMGPGKVTISGTTWATKGGNVLEINRTFRDIRPDGALGKVKGFRYLESSEAIITVNLLEGVEEAIYYGLAGAALSAHVISGGEIGAAAYRAVTFAMEIKGVTATTENTLMTVTLSNCLAEGPVTFTLPDTGEVVLQLKFHAHYDSSTLTTEPWSITFTTA